MHNDSRDLLAEQLLVPDELVSLLGLGGVDALGLPISCAVLQIDFSNKPCRKLL